MTADDVHSRIPSCLIVIPTYREKGNLVPLIDALGGLGIRYHVLVIDDGSDDGTQATLYQLQIQGHPLTVIQRHRKMGLGTAYLLAFSYAKNSGFDYVIQMDADLSHDPTDIPRLMRHCCDRTIVIGSRYVKGGSCESWPWHRYSLSKLANKVVQIMLGLQISDVTSGFKCFSPAWLEEISLQDIASSGFAFQWDFNNAAHEQGIQFVEIPICFHQRKAGQSKMSLAIVLEGCKRLLHVKYSAWRRRKKANEHRHCKTRHR